MGGDDACHSCETVSEGWSSAQSSSRADTGIARRPQPCPAQDRHFHLANIAKFQVAIDTLPATRRRNAVAAIGSSSNSLPTVQGYPGQGGYVATANLVTSKARPLICER